VATIYGVDWRASERSYQVRVEEDVRVRMSDGVNISCTIFMPDADGRFPSILVAHPYTPYQGRPITPSAYSAGVPREGEEIPRASLEAGDPYFFASRGYAFVICNLRGTGRSEGEYCFLCEREVMDVYELIEWAASQPWSSGRVGMFGISYMGWIQMFVAQHSAPSLRCMFNPMGTTDLYRDVFYHGGVFNYWFAVHWARRSLRAHTFADIVRKELYGLDLDKAIKRALADEEISSVEELREILYNYDRGVNRLLAAMIIHRDYDEFWARRTVDVSKISIPTYIGANWGSYALHLNAPFREWEYLKAPKKMVVGPLQNFDRPFYQLHFEALRWFDYWLKGMDTKIMEEPNVRIYIIGRDEWVSSDDWPIKNTRWFPFFLHENLMIVDKDPWPDEGYTTYEDSPYRRGYVKFYTPAFVEKTEILGFPIARLYISTNSSDAIVVLSLYHVNKDGSEMLISKGWARMSYREVDARRTRPWYIQYTYRSREEIVPGRVYEVAITMTPIGVQIKPGEKLALRISSSDENPRYAHERPGSGHLRSQRPSRISIHHNSQYPSHIVLPIISGNIYHLYYSGGIL